jgi:hypothetical protein
VKVVVPEAVTLSGVDAPAVIVAVPVMLEIEGGTQTGPLP